MKNKGLLFTVLVSTILILFPSFSLSQTSLTRAPAVGATSSPDGFCCSNGQVISSSQAQCKKRGQYYQTRGEALRHCRPNNVFCCINGQVSEISPEQCKRSQGIAYSTGAEAKRKCKPKAIYCCLKGKISKVSPEDCKKNRGTAYATSSEAKRKCKPEEVYCCLQGKIKKTSPGDCKKNRGTIYKTATEAKRKCKPEVVYCCLKGSIKKVSSAECKTKKGIPYRSEREARKNCGWCCAENKVFSTTPDVCKRKRGNYFTSKVQADQQCKEQPQCCIEGNLVTYSQLECKRKKGQYYRSYVEAKRRCQVVVGNLRSEVSRSHESLKLKILRPDIPGGIAPPSPNPDPPPPPPPPEPDTFLLHPIEAVPFFNTKGYDSFQVNSVQFATVTDPATNQTHLAAAVVFNRNIDAATVQENINIRLLKQDEETTFWSDVSTQNNVLRIGPTFITWLSGAQLTNGNYKMHLRGTIESENGASLDCDGDGVGEGGALPAYDSQIYQVNGLIQIDLDPGEIRDKLLDILTVSDAKTIPSPVQGDFMAKRRQVVLQQSAPDDIPEKIVKDLNLLKPQSSQFQPVDLTTLIEVTEPSAGDFFSAGEQHDIVFVVKENLTTNCGQIVLYQNGVQVHVINQQFNIRTTPGQGGYHWNVPSHLAGDYQVVVRTCDNSDAGLSGPFLITSYAPDLSVGNISITPGLADTNDTIRVRATVTNIGRTTADSSRAKFTVRDPDGGAHDLTVSIPTLGFGSHHYIQKEFKVNRAGTYEITTSVSVILTTVLETNLANNEVSQNYTIAGVPELVVCCDLFQMATTMHYGGPRGVVYNHGDGPSGATSVNIRVEGKGTVTKSVPALDPSRHHDVGAADWLWAIGNKWLDFHIEVDPGDVVTERSEENNRRDGRLYIYQGTFDGGYPVLDMDTMYGCSNNSIRISNHPYTVTGVE